MAMVKAAARISIRYVGIAERMRSAPATWYICAVGVSYERCTEEHLEPNLTSEAEMYW